MKILNSVQENFAIVGINLNQSAQYHPFNSRKLMVTFVFGTANILSYVSIIQAHTFKEYTDSIHMAIGFTLISSVFGILSFKRTKISELIDSLERIINDREGHTTSEAIFKGRNRITEKWMEIINSCLKMAPMWILLPKLVVNFYFHFKTNSENQGFDLPFPMWFPFDTKNWIGYLSAFFLQYIMFACLFLVASCVVTLGIGGFIFGLAICHDIKNDLSSIQSGGNESKTIKQLSEFVQYHSEAKQLINNHFSDVFQPIFIGVFLWSTIAICSGMLIIQSELKNTAMILFLVSDLTWSFAVLTICCELCQRALDACNDISYDFSQIDWYSYPIKIQKILLQIETNAQISPQFQCFGSFTCERVVIKHVVKKGFSFYMVLRQFGE